MLPKLNSTLFSWNIWRAASIQMFGLSCKEYDLTSKAGKLILQEIAVGWCNGEELPCRPKLNHKAIMCYTSLEPDKDDPEFFWFHLTNKEFELVFGEL